jgi:predicted transcriptional regulator
MDKEDAVAWKAVNALIEDAKSNFKGEQQEAFAWAIYNAVRYTDPSQLENLRELLRKRGIEIRPGDEAGRSWVN